MECHSSESKKLLNLFEESKCKGNRKKREGLDDSNSLVSEDSDSSRHGTVLRQTSNKGSSQDVPTGKTMALAPDNLEDMKRDRDSSHSLSRSPGRRAHRSSRKHQRTTRESLSLALKAGLVSTPRSMSPHQDGDILDCIPQDQDSFTFALIKEASKREKKKRHSRRLEERQESRERDRTRGRERDRHRQRDCENSPTREHRHHRHRRDDIPTKEHTRNKKEENPLIDQVALFETFAKLCAQFNEKSVPVNPAPQVPRTLSHKSLQCEVINKRDGLDTDQQPVRLRSNEQSKDSVTKTRSHENFRGRNYSNENVHSQLEKRDKCSCCYDKQVHPYTSKLNMVRSKMRNVEDERYMAYPPDPRNIQEANYRFRADYRDYNRNYPIEKLYENDKRKYYDQKTNRSYEAHREMYADVDKFGRRTARSDIKDKLYDSRDKYYDDKREPIETRDRFLSDKDRRMKRFDRCERNSIVSRDEEYRDRCSERERDSGLSVADGETSTVSGKSNYLRVVKQEIAEQRETMDKMMKLWKELMRCFKGLSSQTQEKAAHDTAANVQESAAAQLRLWRECMRRYETVARDVGDTDARLMEEINKQRSEMAEMAGMWQECLQRYREMSSDFNNLKQQVTISKQQQFAAVESLTRVPPAAAEGEGPATPAQFRMPPAYPQVSQFEQQMPGGVGYGGSPLRGRASAPPAWWWAEPPPRSPRRRSSPDSTRRRRDRDRDDSRYKEKSSKPSGARSEHRHRKR